VTYVCCALTDPRVRGLRDAGNMAWRGGGVVGVVGRGEEWEGVDGGGREGGGERGGEAEEGDDGGVDATDAGDVDVLDAGDGLKSNGTYLGECKFGEVGGGRGGEGGVKGGGGHHVQRASQYAGGLKRLRQAWVGVYIH
jgi:hypothetical protein